MKLRILFYSSLSFCFLLYGQLIGYAQEIVLSEQTETCLECHRALHPGLVHSWQQSAHARTTPQQASTVSTVAQKVSFKQPLEEMVSKNKAIGCAECHTLNTEQHKDSFDHGETKVHVVVTPSDCGFCHQAEVQQFSHNIMSEAFGILVNNSLYQAFMGSVNNLKVLQYGRISDRPAPLLYQHDSCLACHGTQVKVQQEKKVRETDYGEMEFCQFSGWPNNGVGRINPDGSKGSCSACHARHSFSIAQARKPSTCASCHKGPDVPAFKVYQVSKHGTLYSSNRDQWNFSPVPWMVGRDFTAPTCAACHISLVVNTDGEVISSRTHRMNDRLAWRLLGLIYAHPHPRDADTSSIRNKAQLPLPTELTGEFVTEHLIGKAEQDQRRRRMEKICLSCHSSSWVTGHFNKLEQVIVVTNESVSTATQLVQLAWKKGIATGLPQQASIFDEYLERLWIEHWLFYANSVRFSAAMAGADYGVFANGRWYLTKNLQEMSSFIQLHDKLGSQ